MNDDSPSPAVRDTRPGSVVGMFPRVLLACVGFLASSAMVARMHAQEFPEVPVPTIQTRLEALPGPDELPIREQLPDPLVCNDGTVVSSQQQFDTRRGEMKQMLEYYAVGSMPPPPGNVSGQVLKQQVLNDGAVQYQLLRLTFGKPGTQGFDIGLFRPVGEGPYPVFIHPSFLLTPGGEPLETMPRIPAQGRGRDALRQPLGLPEQPPESPTGPTAHRTDPAETARQYAEVFERGYALAIYHYQDTGEDTIARMPDGSWVFRHSRFVASYPHEDWGLFGCWAWGISRCADYLTAQSYINDDQLIAIGHSRLGKAVLVAGAFDERLAMVVPAGTAGGGVGAYRYCGLQASAETLDLMVKKYPNWFSPRLRSFRGQQTKLPFDQHWFIALTAPRAFLALEGIDDRICSPRAVRESLQAALPIYELYDANSALGVYYADHGHALTTDDWHVVLDFADRELLGRTVSRSFDDFPATSQPQRSP